MERRSRLGPAPYLMCVTDRTLLAANWTLGQAVAPAVTGGANLVLLREAELPATPRLTVARFLIEAVRGRAPVVMSGDPAFALRAGVDGVHVEDPGADLAAIRATIGPDRLLGVSVRSSDDIARAAEAGANYLLAVFDWSHPAEALEAVRRLAAASDVPLIAGLDMGASLAHDCIAAGAAGGAACEPFMAAYNRTAAARDYAAALKP